MIFKELKQKGIAMVVTMAMALGGVGIPIQAAHGEELINKENDGQGTTNLDEKVIEEELEASNTTISHSIEEESDTLQVTKNETAEEKTNEDIKVSDDSKDTKTGKIIDTKEENKEDLEDSEKKFFENSLIDTQTLDTESEDEICYQLKSKGDAVKIYPEKSTNEYFYIIESKEVSLVRGVSTFQDLFDCLEYDSRVVFREHNHSFEMSDVLNYRNYTEGGEESPWLNYPRITTHPPVGVPGHNIAEYIYYIKLQRPISNELSSTDDHNKKVDVSEAFGKNTIESKFLNDPITPLTTVGELKSRLVKDPDATWVVKDKDGTEKQDMDCLRSEDTITVTGTDGDRVYEIIPSYDDMLYSVFYHINLGDT